MTLPQCRYPLIQSYPSLRLDARSFVFKFGINMFLGSFSDSLHITPVLITFRVSYMRFGSSSFIDEKITVACGVPGDTTQWLLEGYSI